MKCDLIVPRKITTWRLHTYYGGVEGNSIVDDVLPYRANISIWGCEKLCVDIFFHEPHVLQKQPINTVDSRGFIKIHLPTEQLPFIMDLLSNDVNVTCGVENNHAYLKTQDQQQHDTGCDGNETMID